MFKDKNYIAERKEKFYRIQTCRPLWLIAEIQKTKAGETEYLEKFILQ